MAQEAFFSVLFAKAKHAPPIEIREAPAFFRDLNLDQVVSAAVAGREEYDLLPLFYTPLDARDEILYRQEVIKDIEGTRVRQAIETFAASMRTMRGHLRQSQALSYTFQKERWFVDVVKTYCDAVRTLSQAIANLELQSEGLIAFASFLEAYIAGPAFMSLLRDTDEVLAKLCEVRYAVLIRGEAITVRRYQGESDYSDEVLRTFARFKEGAVKDYRVDTPEVPQMNHVEERILDLVAQLFPQAFESLDAYCKTHAEFLDETLARFDREIQFYLAYLQYTAPIREAGLALCYPEVSDRHKEVFADAAFDLALAAKLCAGGAPVVCNDFRLEGQERIIVVSGPNQGGKSTFARMVGQLHHLVRLGLPVPGTRSKLFLSDNIFTHFEREEDIAAERGKLEDDLLRIHAILARATSRTLIVMNEIFTSTTLRDAVVLSKKVLEELIRLDALCVWVTFIAEVAMYGPQTVSMMSTVDRDNLAVRTFKIVRQPATGRAYALAIAQKYGLTYETLKERIRR
jgi:DNA mismatch repair protein MutS